LRVCCHLQKGKKRLSRREGKAKRSLGGKRILREVVPDNRKKTEEKQKEKEKRERLRLPLLNQKADVSLELVQMRKEGVRGGRERSSHRQ